MRYVSLKPDGLPILNWIEELTDEVYTTANGVIFIVVCDIAIIYYTYLSLTCHVMQKMNVDR